MSPRQTKPLAQRSRETAAWRLTDAEDPNPHSVYRLFAADGTLLYIGCAADVQHRIYMHRVTYSLADAHLIHRHLDRYTSEEYSSKLAARAAERKAIATERPMFNRQHNPRWRRVNGSWSPADDETRAEYDRLNERPEPDPALREEFDRLFARASP